MKNDKDFSYYISRFLTDYQSGQRNHSKHTIQSYRDTFVLILKYMQDVKGIIPEKITLLSLDRETIISFLVWLEEERGCSISTRNQRLAAIHAFFRYIQSECPEMMFKCQQILAIPSKKQPASLPHYLLANEMKELLALPDMQSRKGRRDATILSVLYDTAARVQELIDLTPRRIRLESPSCITLIGKGNKTRTVPIMSKTMQLLELYMQEHGLMDKTKIDHPVFYNCHGNKLTRQGITYIIQKYSNNKSITPHQFRHSKAMHMTQADVNPIYIRDILGHVDLQTTAIYSKSDLSTKRRALEKANINAAPAVEDWTSNSNLMDYLKSLSK